MKKAFGDAGEEGGEMKETHLVLIITEQGFQLRRIPVDCEIPPASVEQQAADPNLGILSAGSSLDDLVKALNDQFEQVCGQRPVRELSGVPSNISSSWPFC